MSVLPFTCLKDDYHVPHVALANGSDPKAREGDRDTSHNGNAPSSASHCTHMQESTMGPYYTIGIDWG